jgi:hypothetical protein
MDVGLNIIIALDFLTTYIAARELNLVITLVDS